jgi:hypothetical protein
MVTSLRLRLRQRTASSKNYSCIGVRSFGLFVCRVLRPTRLAIAFRSSEQERDLDHNDFCLNSSHQAIRSLTVFS